MKGDAFMSDFLFTVNAVMPIIIMVLIGYLLKRIGIINSDTAKGMNKLVFRLFLPVMLFLNVYKIKNLSDIEPYYMLYAALFTVALFALMLLVSGFISGDASKRGVIIQAAFRSNYALVGIPIAASVVPNGGEVAASLLSTFIVPVFNILAVITLVLFSDRSNDAEEKGRIDIKKLLLDIVKNPLIDAILLGFICLGIRAAFEGFGIGFRLSDISFAYATLEKLSAVATPLALVTLGAGFEFKAIRELKKYIIFATAIRCAAVPVLGFGIALLIGSFNAAHFAAFVGVFATPVAVSSVPMAQEMGADSNLAGQLVVWTTLISSVTVFLCTYLLRVIGVF